MQTSLNLKAHLANGELKRTFGRESIRVKLRATGKSESQLNLIEVFRVISQDHRFMLIIDIFSL